MTKRCKPSDHTWEIIACHVEVLGDIVITEKCSKCGQTRKRILK